MLVVPVAHKESSEQPDRRAPRARREWSVQLDLQVRVGLRAPSERPVRKALSDLLARRGPLDRLARQARRATSGRRDRRAQREAQEQPDPLGLAASLVAQEERDQLARLEQLERRARKVQRERSDLPGRREPLAPPEQAARRGLKVALARRVRKEA